jgi:hypothetical protein
VRGDHQTSDDRLWPASPRASTDCGKRMALATVMIFGLKPCWQRLVAEGGEVGRDHHAGDDLGIGGLEGVDLGGEIVGQVLVAAGIGQWCSPAAAKPGPTPTFGSPQALPSPSLGKQAADLLVGLDLVPHVQEDGDHVLQPPEVVEGEVEGRQLAGSPGLPCWPMNQGCQGALVEMTGMPSPRRWWRRGWSFRGWRRRASG